MSDDEEYDDYLLADEQAAKSLAEALKQNLCAQIDSHTERFVTEEREERKAVKELAQLTSMLRVSGNSTASRDHLPLTGDQYTINKINEFLISGRVI